MKLLFSILYLLPHIIMRTWALTSNRKSYMLYRMEATNYLKVASQTLTKHMCNLPVKVHRLFTLLQTFERPHPYYTRIGNPICSIHRRRKKFENCRLQHGWNLFKMLFWISYLFSNIFMRTLALTSNRKSYMLYGMGAKNCLKVGCQTRKKH